MLIHESKLNKVDFTKQENRLHFISQINAGNFEDIALSLFQYQYQNNKVYQSYVDALHIQPNTIHTIEAIPFLPISFFKTHEVVTGDRHVSTSTLLFESSGTSQTINSKHFVFQPEVYEASFFNGFQQFFGKPEDYIFLALLPSYLERSNSSLVYMVSKLMERSNHPANGFYLNEWSVLTEKLQQMKQSDRKILLIGVTFALLDFADAFPMNLEHVMVMETGGMKGRKEEWTRNQVHDFLQEKWHLNNVVSEYGMTELLSQAYAINDGVFHCSSTMKVLVRDVNDPLTTMRVGFGCLNIIDLANVDSCAFIATEDVGIVQEDGSFMVLGRMDNAALRGCSLMSI